MSVFVGRLSHSVSDLHNDESNQQKLRDFFSDCGPIEKIDIRTGRSFFTFFFFIYCIQIMLMPS